MNPSDVVLEDREFLSEETAVFSSLITKLKELPQQKDTVTKCLLGILWKLRKEEKLLNEILEDVGVEISDYEADPSRESNRTKKVIVCGLYRILASGKEDAYNHDTTISAYLNYARDSGNWLGQPRVACCLSFLTQEYDFGREAGSYMQEELKEWLQNGNDEGIALALLSIGERVSQGDLQNILEHIGNRLEGNSTPLGVLSTYLIGLSRVAGSDEVKNDVEDNIFFKLKEHISKYSNGDESYKVDDLVTSAIAIQLAKYHSISGYYEKYSENLKKMISQKEEVKKYSRRGRLYNTILYLLIMASSWLFFSVLFLLSNLNFEGNQTIIVRSLKYIGSKSETALIASIIITAYTTFSFAAKGDPIVGLFNFFKEKFPGLSKKE